MSFLSDLGSAFSGGADDAAVKAGQLKADGYKRAADAIGAGETKALGYTANVGTTYDPIYRTGTSALARLTDLYGLNGADAAKSAQGAFLTSPNYEWRVSEGTKALDRGAAAKGGLYSGAAGKALINYGQNVAGNEYGNWVAGLSNLAGYSVPGAAGKTTGDLKSADVVTNAASGRASALTGEGDALAAGEIGRANAVSGGINNVFKLGGMLVSMATGMPVGMGSGASFGTDIAGNPNGLLYGSNPFTPSGGRNPAYG